MIIILDVGNRPIRVMDGDFKTEGDPVIPGRPLCRQPNFPARLIPPVSKDAVEGKKKKEERKRKKTMKKGIEFEEEARRSKNHTTRPCVSRLQEFVHELNRPRYIISASSCFFGSLAAGMRP